MDLRKLFGWSAWVLWSGAACAATLVMSDVKDATYGAYAVGNNATATGWRFTTQERMQIAGIGLRNAGPVKPAGEVVLWSDDGNLILSAALGPQVSEMQKGWWVQDIAQISLDPGTYVLASADLGYGWSASSQGASSARRGGGTAGHPETPSGWLDLALMLADTEVLPLTGSAASDPLAQRSFVMAQVPAAPAGPALCVGIMLLAGCRFRRRPI